MSDRKLSAMYFALLSTWIVTLRNCLDVSREITGWMCIANRNARICLFCYSLVQLLVRRQRNSSGDVCGCELD